MDHRHLISSTVLGLMGFAILFTTPNISLANRGYHGDRGMSGERWQGHEYQSDRDVRRMPDYRYGDGYYRDSAPYYPYNSDYDYDYNYRNRNGDYGDYLPFNGAGVEFDGGGFGIDIHN